MNLEYNSLSKGRSARWDLGGLEARSSEVDTRRFVGSYKWGFMVITV